MAKSKFFQIGDEVVGSYSTKGMDGVVVDFSAESDNILVRYPGWRGGHMGGDSDATVSGKTPYETEDHWYEKDGTITGKVPEKVGDRVRINPKSRYYGDSLDNPADTPGTVDYISKKAVGVKWDNSTHNSYSPDDLIRVKEAIMPAKKKRTRINRGDKVELLRRFGGNAKVGDIGVVVEIRSEGYIVDFPSQSHYLVSKDGVKKVPKAKAATKAVKREKVEPIKKLHLSKHDILGQDKIHKQLEIAVDMDMPVLIVGDTGTGKTTIVKSIADKREAEYIRFNLTGETTVDEFVGKYVLHNEETQWEDGVLLTAMKQGKWLIVDEVNVALPEILFVLHSLLDDDRSVMVSNHQGEVVKPHKNFRFFGTMNPVDEYAGTKDLNKAFKSRFGMILNMQYPSTKTETQIVHSKADVSLEHAVKIVDVAQKIRKAKQESEVFYTCSTRDAIQWGSLVEKLGLQDAFEVSILNKANGDRDMVMAIYKGVVGAYKQAADDGHILNLDELIKINQQVKQDKAELAKSKSDIEKQVREKLLKGLLENGDKKTIQGTVVKKALKEVK